MPHTHTHTGEVERGRLESSLKYVNINICLKVHHITSGSVVGCLNQSLSFSLSFLFLLYKISLFPFQTTNKQTNKQLLGLSLSLSPLSSEPKGTLPCSSVLLHLQLCWRRRPWLLYLHLPSNNNNNMLLLLLFISPFQCQ